MAYNVAVSNKLLATRAQKLFFLVVVAEGLIVVAMVTAVFGLVENAVATQTPLLKTIPVYLAIFVLAMIFLVIITLDAIRLRNIIQVVGIIIFNLLLLVYSALQIPQTRDALRDSHPDSANPTNCRGSLYLSCDGPKSLYSLVQKLLIVVPVIIGVCECALVWLARGLFEDFGWDVFRALGADLRLKARYRTLQILVVLLKFDIFFLFGFCGQFLILVPSYLDRPGGGGQTEFNLTIAALPISLLVTIACIFAAKREIKTVMGICLAIFLAGMAYALYKFISIFLPETRRYFRSTKVTLGTFAIFSTVLLGLTFVYGCMTMANFGKGLLNAQEPTRAALPSFALTSPTGSNEGSRPDSAAFSMDPRMRKPSSTNGSAHGGGRDPPRMVIE